ncbi:MAG: ferrochelatase [Caulobacteraceae bacterium]|nr:ferrochelatase [Caulobacteraceae bacterium]
MSLAGKRIAVVLFNLGGPDDLAAVRPFLFNLFRDPAIIDQPALLRYPLAALISTARTKTAQANYALMGGRSPLLEETRRQAATLRAALEAAEPAAEWRVEIAMRYWRPFAGEAAEAVAAFAPDEVVLLPLYPQYSTTTTGSSLADWGRAYRGPGRSRAVCCYPIADGLIEAHAGKIEAAWVAAGRPAPVRLLFSAHGLPQQVIDAGDPYQAQVEATAKAVAGRLGAGWDWQVCYQSKVGRLEWLKPSTESAIGQAIADGVGVILSPIAFVSEHVETLVELDHEYAALARAKGCTTYLRVPALGVEAAFVDALALAVRESLGADGVTPASGWRCPDGFPRCALKEAAR